MNDLPPVKETPPCDHCGGFDAQQIGDRWLCVDCYSNSGAGCCGNDKDDSSC